MFVSNVHGTTGDYSQCIVLCDLKFCILVSEATGDQMVLAYSIVGRISDLYVANRDGRWD